MTTVYDDEERRKYQTIMMISHTWKMVSKDDDFQWKRCVAQSEILEDFYITFHNAPSLKDPGQKLILAFLDTSLEEALARTSGPLSFFL